MWWLLHLVPDGLLHFIVLMILFVGAGLYSVSYLFIFFPFLTAYKETARIIGTLMSILGVYYYGGYGVEMEWRGRVQAAEQRAHDAEERAKMVNFIIQDHYTIDTNIVHEKNVEIREHIKEVEKRINGECKLDPIVPKLHNEAAENPFFKEKDKGETK